MMTATQATLARAIAASGHPWATPGIACCDPETQARFRYTAGDYSWVPDNDHAVTVEDAGLYGRTVQRALPNGPDLSDDAVHLLLPQIARAMTARDSEPTSLVDVLTAVCREAMRGPGTDWPSVIARVWLRVHGCEVP